MASVIALVGGSISGLSAQERSAKAGERAGRFVTISLSGQADHGRGPREKGSALQANRPARMEVQLRDPATGFGIGGVGMFAWIAPDNGMSCPDWFRRVDRNSQLPSDVIPLVGFDIVQITQDNRIAVVDPQVSLASANIRSIAPLPGRLKAWAFAPDGRVAGITAQDGKVILVDASAAKVEQIPGITDAHGLTMSGSGLWIGMSDGRAIPMLASGASGAAVAVGEGNVAILAGGNLPTVALAADGRGRMLDRGQAFNLGERVGGATLSPLANSLFALSQDGRTVLVADLDTQELVRRIALDDMADRIIASPSGRWVALASPDGGRMTIIDSETMQVRWTAVMPDPVVEMAFSQSFLYFRHRRQAGVTRMTFDALAAKPGLSAIASGVPTQALHQAGPLPRLMRIESGGMLLASEHERRAYIIEESSKLASEGTIALRAGDTEGVLVRQRGLLPSGKTGTYSGWFTAPGDGRYLAIVRTQSPEFVQCQAFVVGKPGPRRLAAAEAATPAPGAKAGIAGGMLTLILPKSIAISRVLVMRNDGGWRQFLTPAPGQLSGTVIRWPLDEQPGPGQYQVYIEYRQADGTTATLSTQADVGQDKP
ncbi:MAG: YncE family protein [Novosphingobium sp.]